MTHLSPMSSTGPFGARWVGRTPRRSFGREHLGGRVRPRAPVGQFAAASFRTTPADRSWRNSSNWCIEGRMKLATWNINSVRLRLGLVVKLLKKEEPDVLCLQETKVVNDLFPAEAFKKLG